MHAHYSPTPSTTVCTPLGSQNATPATLAACGPSRIRQPSALPWAHEVPLLPLWPQADRCGFRHRLPSPRDKKCHSCRCGRTRTVATSATVWPRLRLRHATPATVAADGLMCIRPCLPSPGLTKCHSRHFGRMRTDVESASVCPPLGSRRATPATLAACGPLRIRPPPALPSAQEMPLLPLWPHADHCGFHADSTVCRPLDSH